MAIGTAVNVLLSKSMAANDVEESNAIVKNVSLLIIVLSIIIPLIVLPSLGTILHYMNAGVTFNACVDYVFILILCIGIFLISDISPFFLRLQGYIKIPVYITILTSVFNMILNPICIYWLGLGIRGASLATVTSALVSSLLLVFLLYVKRTKYVSFKGFKFNKQDFSTIKSVLRLAIPIILQSLLSLVFAMILNRFLLYEGLISITAYSFANRLIAFVTIPYTAFSSSMVSVMGFLVGSDQYDEMIPNYKYALLITEIFTIVPCILLFLGSDFLSTTLYQTKDILVYNQISLSIKFLVVYYVFQAACVMVDSMFLSIKKPEKSFMLIFVGVVVEVIVLAYMEYSLHIPNSIYYVLIVGSLIQFIVFTAIFKRDFKKFFNNQVTQKT